MTRVFVSGGTGYIAYNLIEALLKQGDDVVASVRSTTSDKSLALLALNDSIPTGSLSLGEADLLLPDNWANLIDGCEIVYHLANPFRLHAEDPDDIIKPGILGSYHVMMAAAQCESVKQVLFTSSVISIIAGHPSARYSGNGKLSSRKVKLAMAKGKEISKKGKLFQHTETSVLRNTSIYDTSKTLAEAAAWYIYRNQVTIASFRQTNPFGLAVVCPGYVFGRQHKVHADSEVSILVKDLFNGKYPVMPEISCPHVAAVDVVACMIKAAVCKNTNVVPHMMFNDAESDSFLQKYLFNTTEWPLFAKVLATNQRAASLPFDISTGCASRFILCDKVNGNQIVNWQAETLASYFVHDIPVLDNDGTVLVKKWTEMKMERGLELKETPKLDCVVVGKTFLPLMWTMAFFLPELNLAIPMIGNHTFADNSQAEGILKHKFTNVTAALIEHALCLIENDEL